MNKKLMLQGRIKIGKISEMMFPDTASCGRCHMSFAIDVFHSTPYRMGSGCFPLCEYCWKDMSPEERLPYYMELVDSWVSHGDDNYNGVPWEKIREMISTAVLDGK